ncbi:MAG: glutathione S-transferase family protein [Pseudolabrys sp.]
MADFLVHSIPGSPYGRAVFMALEEKGAAWRIVPVSPNGLKAHPHLGRHPFGHIPVLEHDGFMLYETQAILRYLDRIIPTSPLSPTDPQHIARMDQVMNICDWYLFQGVGNVIGFQRIVKPMLTGLPPDEAAIAAANPKAQLVFRELSLFLGENRWFAGEMFSLADIVIAAQLEFLSHTPEWPALIAGRDNLARWLARVSERPSFAATTWERLSARAQEASVASAA